ncbi:MAG: GtrA family protein, partial [Candidatus Methanomethylophilaceae archaeon]|nr:GtrA family protein [Candidatus Methanomethylophilaceae archaeon]
MGLIKDLLIRYREAVLYVFFGGLTTLVSWGTYYVMAKWLEWDLNLSNVLSWVIGVLFAFAVNKWFVFEAKSRDKKVVSKEITLFIGG